VKLYRAITYLQCVHLRMLVVQGGSDHDEDCGMILRFYVQSGFKLRYVHMNKIA
jgi:hypothetical protein